VTAAGGRIRYVAAPRSTIAAPATTPACARCAAPPTAAAGQPALRRLQGTAPSLARELRVLAGCLLHGRACAA
jgi:hypothetical protein